MLQKAQGSMKTSVPPDPVTDPDELALLAVQQYLRDMGFTSALQSIEHQTQRKFLDSKLPHGSILLEMVYRHLEAVGDGDEEAAVAGRARIAEDALLNSAAATLPESLVTTIDGVHTAAVTSLAVSDDGAAVFSGTGNGVVRRLTPSGEEAWATPSGHGGVLSLAPLPITASGQERLVATTMDGSVALLDAASGAMLASLQPHRKYVVKAVRLQADGETRIATASWDGSLAVHRLSEEGNCLETLTVTSYDHGVADLAVLPDSPTVVVAVKETPYLHLFDGQTLQASEPAGKVNMNDKDWDDTLSFAATNLAVSPCGNFLLVSTDGPRLMVFRTRDWTKAKILYGLQTAMQFHQHIAVWWGSAHIVAAAASGAAFIFSTASGKVVTKLAAHPGSNVRTMASDEAHGKLYTGSFDKTVKVYGSSSTEVE